MSETINPVRQRLIWLNPTSLHKISRYSPINRFNISGTPTIGSILPAQLLLSLSSLTSRQDPCGIADSLSDTSIIEIYRDYRIRANRLGLCTLASSITGVFSGVNGSEKGDE